MSLSKFIGFTHLFNGLSFDGNDEFTLKRVKKTLQGGFAVVGVKEAITGSVPSFIGSRLTGLGLFIDNNTENVIYLDWVVCYPFKSNSLQEEYKERIYSVVLGYVFKQNSVFFASQHLPSYEIIIVDKFLQENTISLTYYLARIKKTIGSLYHPDIKKEFKR